MSWNKGISPSLETRKKISESRKGKHHSLETKRKISESQKGKINSPEARLKMSLAKKGKPLSIECREALNIARRNMFGERAPNWNGGLIIDRKGYLLQYAPNHPNARIIRGRHIYVPAHRLIVEKALGRFLKQTEIIHHVNGIKTDNRNSNLVICQDESCHQFLHKRMRDLDE